MNTTKSICLSALGYIIMFLCLQIVLCKEVSAQTYHVATNGSDNNPGTESQPWATFSKAMTVLKPGDTLLIKDGTYYQTLDITISGSPDNPITIKAQNEGKAIIDGEYKRNACYIKNAHDINVEGIHVKRGSPDNFYINDSDRINIRKVSSYLGCDTTCDNAAGGISTYLSSYVLIEDCIIYNNFRVGINALDSDHITIRRNWIGTTNYPYRWDPGDLAYGIQIYGSDDCIVENNVVQALESRSSPIIAIWNFTHYYNNPGERNKFLGNIVIGNGDDYDSALGTKAVKWLVRNNFFENNVSINNQAGFYHKGGIEVLVNKLTAVNSLRDIFTQTESTEYPQDPDYATEGTVKNSIFLTSPHTAIYKAISNSTLVSRYNTAYDVAQFYSGSVSDKTGDNQTNPVFNTSTYGKGAYLMSPSNLKGTGEGGANRGAEVLYRYIDGKLTSIPLWPWPMEDRIKAETGYSVTWEAGGGLWKTLNGVYTNTSSDTTPPSQPSIIKIETK